MRRVALELSSTCPHSACSRLAVGSIIGISSTRCRFKCCDNECLQSQKAGRDRVRENGRDRDRQRATWALLSYLHTQLKTSSTLITFKWTSKCRQQPTNWLPDSLTAWALGAWQRALRRCWCVCLSVRDFFCLFFFAKQPILHSSRSGSVIFEFV